MSMNSSSSANSTMSSYFSSSWSRVSPAASPPSFTFWRPVRSLLKPTPSASSVLTRPCTSTRPAVGGRMPAIVRTSVEVPAAFAPMIPTTEPRASSSDTSFTALISRTVRSRRPSRTTMLLKVGFFSSDVREVTDTSSTLIAGGGVPSRGGAAGAGAAELSETDGKLTLPRHEEKCAADEQHDPPGKPEQHVAGLRWLPGVQDVAPRRQQRADRVDREQRLVLVRDLVGVVE